MSCLMVEVVRSGVAESRHHGDAVVVKASGDVLACAGDPVVGIFARSAAKPFQALASLRAMGSASEMGDEDLAVACGSHTGEPVHVAAVLCILAKVGLDEDALRCPAVLPLDARSRRALERGGQGPRPVFHNCSGKHALMLAACVARGWPTNTYEERRHPLQIAAAELFAEYADEVPFAYGVDGCGVPVYGVTLKGLATAYARLAARSAEGDADCSRILHAMRTMPFLAGGTGELATAAMRVTPDLLVKAGAEGIVAAAHLSRGLGFALKVEDGASRASAPAASEALVRLGWISGEALEEFRHPAVFGGGKPVGCLRADEEFLSAISA